ncbi:hypothetical protein B0H13DRAFT_2335080 [Mycena leptocephala]|nr:hypothetical protein B0H13DRAFT_2335080 [Mycena leptocephala]
MSVVQPLETNEAKTSETPGMMQAMLDYEGQMGLDQKAMEGLIVTPVPPVRATTRPFAIEFPLGPRSGTPGGPA